MMPNVRLTTSQLMMLTICMMAMVLAEAKAGAGLLPSIWLPFMMAMMPRTRE